MALISDLRHFLDEKGALPDGIPAPAEKLANHLGAIVAAATSTEDVFQLETPVPCRMRPYRRQCVGFIRAGFQVPENSITWHCPVCGDEGIISGWEKTMWDRTG